MNLCICVSLHVYMYKHAEVHRTEARRRRPGAKVPSSCIMQALGIELCERAEMILNG